MKKSVHLKSFTTDEILLSEADVKVFLKFLWPSKSSSIDSATIDLNLSSFAQGLLVEAIDATYAMGYVHQAFSALHSAILPPTNGNAAVKLIKSFGKKAAPHWFRHATSANLAQAKIYETVRVSLARSFGRVLDAKLLGLAIKAPPTAIIEYASTQFKSERVWA